jgi:hypothetical protein
VKNLLVRYKRTFHTSSLTLCSNKDENWAKVQLFFRKVQMVKIKN